MRTSTRLAAVVALSAASAAVGAVGEREPGIRQATLRTRVVSVMSIPEEPGPPRIRLADVDLRGALPEGFDPDPSAGPLSLEVELNGVTVWGGPDDPMLLAPTGRLGEWGPAPSSDPDWTVEYARWLRASLDVDRGTFHFRTRGVDHAVMEGSPESVPYVIRIGGEEISGTLDFPVAGRNVWRVRDANRSRVILDR